MNIDDLPLIQARNFTRCALPRVVRLIVIHTTENHQKSGVARGVAEWFAGVNAPQASAHYVVDDLLVINCVKPVDIAWAVPGANRDGVHVEHVGFAAQSPEEWDSDFSRSMLWLSAQLTAELARIYDVTIERVDPEVGACGFCGHADVTRWRNGGKGHTDPGVNFPWDQYLALVRTFTTEGPVQA